MLVRDADALQRASTLDTLVFDKTGTLTEGKPQVVAVKTFNGVDEAQALRLAAALEQGSSHPLAHAILEKAGDDKLPQVNGFRTLRGLGVSGEAEGHQLLLGNQALLNEQHVATDDMTAEITAQARKARLRSCWRLTVKRRRYWRYAIHCAAIVLPRLNACTTPDTVW